MESDPIDFLIPLIRFKDLFTLPSIQLTNFIEAETTKSNHIIIIS